MATDNGTPRRRGAHFSTPGQQSDNAAAQQHVGSMGQQASTAPASTPLVSGATGFKSASAPGSAGATGSVAGATGMQTARISNRTASATSRAGSRSVHKRNNQPSGNGKLPVIIGGVAVVVIAAAVIFGIVIPHLTSGTSSDSQEVQTGTQVNVTVPSGAGTSEIAALLYDNGVIASKSEFLSMVRKLNAELSLQSGSYTFTAGDDMSNIVNLLSSGPNASGITLTIPEGYTVARIASAVESALGIPADVFTEQAKASNYVGEYDFLADAQNDSLEGFLFPKTYTFTDDVTADSVIRTMLNQFKTEFSSLDMSYPESQGLSVADVVNLASIVEKESTSETLNKVAGVFYNRLTTTGYPTYGYLQSDATTAYSVGHDPSGTEVHDESDPYSTYANAGLPPTPICNPGLAALQAVCSPDMETIEGGYYYFYFWTNSDGNTEYAFSQTYEEHNAAIAAHS